MTWTNPILYYQALDSACRLTPALRSPSMLLCRVQVKCSTCVAHLYASCLQTRQQHTILGLVEPLVSLWLLVEG